MVADYSPPLHPPASQLKSLQSFEADPSIDLLKKVIEEFRDEELEHLDTAVEEGAQMAPGHALLSAVVGMGCRGAIWVSERV
ncbi:3-demethoxyubiquinol 3-hydroxylase, partial [Tremellales sp. Uapishka_1]